MGRCSRSKSGACRMPLRSRSPEVSHSEHADTVAVGLLEDVIPIARAAGDAVLDVYGRGCAALRKDDGSPLTEADRRAQEIICPRLAALAPTVPIVAEESAELDCQASAAACWLVDPIDGTKELLARNGEFTINIALILAGAPVLGVILAPALGR